MSIGIVSAIRFPISDIALISLSYPRSSAQSAVKPFFVCGSAALCIPFIPWLRILSDSAFVLILFQA